MGEINEAVVRKDSVTKPTPRVPGHGSPTGVFAGHRRLGPASWGQSLRFYSLRNAQTKAARIQGRVFAGDYEAKKGMVKFFIADTEAGALETIYRMAEGSRNYYEAVDSAKPCLAYFDLDLTVKGLEERYLEELSKAFPDEFCSEFMRFHLQCADEGLPQNVLQHLRVFVLQFMKEELTNISGNPINVSILDASSEKKFSLHVHTDMILESNVVEGSALALELNRRLLVRIWEKVVSAPDEQAMKQKDVLWGMLLFPKKLPTDVKAASVGGVIDCSVYSRNRLFRMYGNCKKGSDRILRECTEDGLVCPLPKDSQLLARICRKYLIQRSSGFEHSAKVYRINVTGCVYSSLNSRRGYSARSAALKVDELPLTSKLVWEHVIKQNGLHVFAHVQEPGVGEGERERGLSEVRNRVISHSEPAESRCRIILSDDPVYFEGATYSVQAGILERGQVLHCVDCDLTMDKGPDGNPSARAIRTDDLDRGYYCFCCLKTYIVRNRVDYEGFKEEAEICLQMDDDERHFDYRFLRDLFNNRDYKVIAINARMGTGKTEAVKQLLASKENVLIVTYRQALARQLATRFHAFLYMDEGGAVRSWERSRVVICLDSLMRVNREGYDYVVLDEAGFIRRHFMGGTMRDKRTVVYDRLGDVLNYSSKVFMMQDGLTHQDIEFFTLLLEGRNKVAKVFIEKKSHLVNAEICTDFFSVLTTLYDDIVAGKKVFVPVSLRTMAVKIYDFIVSKCQPPSVESQEEWEGKVCLVVGIDEICRGVRNGIEFIDRYPEFDVVVATSVLETGVSLDGHYTHVIGFFSKIPLPHRSQIQLVNRVREPEKVTAYVERGTNCRYRVDKNLLKKMFATEMAVSAEFTPTYVDIQSEVADVLNNNDLLWEENWLCKRIDPRYGAGGVKSAVIREFQSILKQHTEGIRKYLQALDVSSVTFSMPRRAALIKDQATLVEEDVLKLLIPPAVPLAKKLKVQLKKMRRSFWITTFYFMLDKHERTREERRSDTEWTDLICSSSSAGNVAPFNTIAIVQTGRKLMIHLFNSAIPQDGTDYVVTDETYPRLISFLKDLQRWVGAENYSHSVGLMGPFIRDIQRTFDDGVSINRKLVTFLRKTTPFVFSCRKRQNVVVHGETEEVRKISVRCATDEVALLLGASKRQHLHSESLHFVTKKILEEDLEGFKVAAEEWISGFRPPPSAE